MTNLKNFKVEVKKDHLSKISKSTPSQAIAELIWNGLDADANNIRIKFRDGNFGIDQIIIEDDGYGIYYEEVEDLFGFLGGSWKITKSITPKGRVIHGKEGQGRFKAFALGRVVKWDVIFFKNEKFYEFQIRSLSEKPDVFSISSLQESIDSKTGVKVTIEELHKNYTSLTNDKLINNLLPQFAIYLTKYLNIKISIDSKTFDPSKIIIRKKNIHLKDEIYQEQSYSGVLEIIEWSSVQHKDLFYCDENGFTLGEYNHQIRSVGDFSFSSYLKSSLISILKEDGVLDLGGLVPSLQNFANNAVKEIKDYFLERTIEESKSELQKWKDEKIYPYDNSPDNPVEKAERQVFDIVAINIKNSLPDFDNADRRSKAFQLRMLRQAIEKSPEELQTIISEVLQLPKKSQTQLAELLQEVSLTSIISASRLVSDRLKFISGLEHLLFDDDTKKHLKERSQLHRILSENTWVFGDAFSLSVDDQSLTEVLRKHAKLAKISIAINEPVIRIDGRVGIVDLMLSRTIPRNRSSELEHLVVELKAPKVTIGESEIQQIKSYAIAVAKDERFRAINTKWNFWIISNDYDDYAEIELDQEAYEEGVIFKTNKKVNVTVWLKTWSQLIQEVKYRLEFIREKLNYNVDKSESLKYLKETYSEFTKGLLIVEKNDVEEEINTEAAASHIDSRKRPPQVISTLCMKG